MAVDAEVRSLRLQALRAKAAHDAQLGSDLRMLRSGALSALAARAKAEGALRTAEDESVGASARHSRLVAQASLQMRKSWTRASPSSTGMLRTPPSTGKAKTASMSGFAKVSLGCHNG